MTTQLAIMDAVQALAAEALPELRRIYTDLVPSDFLRPCLLVQPVTTTREDAAQNLSRITDYYTLTVFDETDDYSNSDTRRLLEWQQRVMDLFRPGYLEVDGRARSVQASTGGRDWDKAYVDLQFSYHDLRDETPDTTPKMGSVETNMSLKETE